MSERICVKCAYYKAPGFFEKNFTASPFKDKCTHPRCASEVDGTPMACVTCRLMRCENGILFKPKDGKS